MRRHRCATTTTHRNKHDGGGGGERQNSDCVWYLETQTLFWVQTKVIRNWLPMKQSSERSNWITFKGVISSQEWDYFYGLIPAALCMSRYNVGPWTSITFQNYILFNSDDGSVNNVGCLDKMSQDRWWWNKNSGCKLNTVLNHVIETCESLSCRHAVPARFGAGFVKKTAFS